VTAGEALSVLRSFERSGWIVAGAVSTIDTGDGADNSQALDADAIEQLDDDPLYLRARFGDANTGNDIIEYTFTDGVEYQNDPSITVPSLLVSVIVTQQYDATGISDPSVLSNLRTIDEAIPTATQAAVVGGSAVMLMLIVGYPGSLLSSVVSARYDDLHAWFRKRLPAKAKAALRKKQPRVLLWLGFVVAAVIAAFVDPAFGLNWMSARVMLSALLGFLVFNLLGWSVVRILAKRIEPGVKPEIEFRWGSLLIVAAAVLVARLLEFNPGVIFGLVAGLTFGVTLAASKDAIVKLLGVAFAVAAALVGWIGYSLLAPIAASAPANFVAVFVTEFFSGVTVEGISSLPLALLPFATLDGEKLLKWKKWVWAISYTVGVALFMFVLLNVPGSWGTIPGDFVRWISLFVAFAVVAIVIWTINEALTRRKKRLPEKVPA
jgi:hypothetical protein